jgi:hypothetical protein
MKVSDLAHLLQNLSEGLRPVVPAGVVSDIAALQTAMSPFADRTVADFTAFLAKCEEYQRTGVIPGGGKKGGKAAAPKPAADPARVGAFVESVRALLREIDRDGVDGHRIDQVLQPINALAKAEVDQILAALGIVGATKTKKLALDKLRTMLTNQAEAGTRVRSMSEHR